MVDRCNSARSARKPQLWQLDLGSQWGRDCMVRLDEGRAQQLARPELPHLPQVGGPGWFWDLPLERLGLPAACQVYLRTSWSHPGGVIAPHLIFYNQSFDCFNLLIEMKINCTD